jgi:hypothetical protein
MLENVMRRTWISTTAAAAISVVSAGHSWAQVSAGSAEAANRNQAHATQDMQNGRDSLPGAENMDKRAERMQSAAPMSEGQGQKPAGKSD